MIRFKKSFFDAYYKESFYKDLGNKTLKDAMSHLFVACLFGAFFASMSFYFIQKNKVEEFILSTIDTVSNEYPYSYKMSINERGILESNINPVFFFDANTAGQGKGSYPDKLIVIDSNNSLETANLRNYNAHYVFLSDGYYKKMSGEKDTYKGHEGFSISRSKVDILLMKIRTLAPFIPGVISFCVFFAVLLFYPLQYLVKSLFIGLLLYILFNYAFKEKLTYKGAYTLSVFAGGTVLLTELLFIILRLPVFPMFETLTAIIFVFLMHRNATYFPIKLHKLKLPLKKKSQK